MVSEGVPGLDIPENCITSVGAGSSPRRAASIWSMASLKFCFFKFLSVANWAFVLVYENKSFGMIFALQNSFNPISFMFTHLFNGKYDERKEWNVKDYRMDLMDWNWPIGSLYVTIGFDWKSIQKWLHFSRQFCSSKNPSLNQLKSWRCQWGLHLRFTGAIEKYTVFLRFGYSDNLQKFQLN